MGELKITITKNHVLSGNARTRQAMIIAIATMESVGMTEHRYGRQSSGFLAFYQRVMMLSGNDWNSIIMSE